MSVFCMIVRTVLGCIAITYMSLEFSNATSTTMATLYVVCGVGWLGFILHPFMTGKRNVTPESSLEKGDGVMGPPQFPLITDEKLNVARPAPSPTPCTQGVVTAESLDLTPPRPETDQSNKTPDLAVEGYGQVDTESTFCRALYDYENPNVSSELKIRKGNVIEILGKQPSGWWDGLLGEERGWFPSNYVTLISVEEAMREV
ncbi:cell division control protein [Moniliophthora roreri MCA 2997]|uniref:Cell division control protein n=2 Tax=Moniliophthora roreri TaxID=221103 RepID=V2WNQ9_MONRO|nr:cell division control protein [Moniliophthora roreri MCA 2997]KAI3597626.1 cell division control protein [Moniliophthora roreri]